MALGDNNGPQDSKGQNQEIIGCGWQEHERRARERKEDVVINPKAESHVEITPLNPLLAVLIQKRKFEAKTPIIVKASKAFYCTLEWIGCRGKNGSRCHNAKYCT